MHAHDMIRTHPQVQGNPSDALVRMIEEAYACAQSCIACADACLGEEMVADLRQCIRLNLDCGEICQAAGRMASRRTGSNETVLRAVIEACARSCRECGEECGRHADRHEHCRICAEACRTCAEACDAAARDVG